VKFSPGTFDFSKVNQLAEDLATWLLISHVRRLSPGEVTDFGGRYGCRVNSRREIARVVIGQLLVRADGSGHGPPELAQKVIGLCRGDAVEG